MHNFFFFLRIIWQITHSSMDAYLIFQSAGCQNLSLYLYYKYAHLWFKWIQMKFKIFGYKTSFLVQFYCLTNFDNHLIYWFRIQWWWKRRQQLFSKFIYFLHIFWTFTHTHSHVYICIILLLFSFFWVNVIQSVNQFHTNWLTFWALFEKKWNQ